MSSAKNSDIQSEIDELYGKMYTLNDLLLQRSEKTIGEGEIYSAVDIFDFYISSHAMAYLKYLYIGDMCNISIYLSARCILEGLALKRLCQREVVGTVKEELLQKQVFLVEYKYYKNFDDIAEKILLPEKLIIDFRNACTFYEEKLANECSSEKIEKIIKSPIPFLCQSYTNYRKIIAEELGEECASLYGLCSSFVHPSTNDAYKSDCFQLVLPIYALLKVEYENLPKSKSSLSLDFAQTRSPISDDFYNLMSEETSILCSVANVFDQKFGNNYVSNTFRTIGYILPDLAIEKQLGLTEQTKCKWKIVVELCATFDYIYVKLFGEELRFKLLDLHGQVQELRNINKEYDLDEAYQVYCQIYKLPCDKERFEDGFKQPLGYLIDQNGSVPSLTKVVCEFIKKFESKNESGISGERAMLLDYMESQMISHANGYMWFANSGAFSDTNNIFKGIDISLMTIFRELHAVFLTHRVVEESKEYKSIINILRNSQKKLDEIIKAKASILALPMAHKWHVS